MVSPRWRARASAATVAVALLAGTPTTAGAVVGTPPDPPIITGPSGTVASTSASITVTPASPGDAVTCFYNGDEITCPGSWTYTDLEQGPHTVTAYSSNAAGTSDTVYVYWKVDTVGPVASLAAPTSLTTTATVSFNENVSGVTAASLKLTTDAGTVSASRTCLTTTLEPTACGGPDVRKVRLLPDGGWVLGEQYTVRYNSAGSATIVDALGNVGATSTPGFRAQTSVQESALTYTWREASKARALGGSYLVERRAGSSLTWDFSGSRLTWVTVTGRAHGTAEVYVDRKLQGTVNTFTKRTRYGVERTFTRLGSGAHTVEIRPLGRTGAQSGTNTLVAVDGFVTKSGSVASPRPASQAWQRGSDGSADNGYYAVADLAGQTAALEFRGTAVTLHTARGPAYGQVTLLVDGAPVATADLYAATTQFGQTVTATGLTDARHSLEIRVLGAAAGGSTGTGVVVDAVSVP